MAPDINHIIDGCLKGDAVCQERLYKLLAPKLMGVCLRYVKARQEAEDCLQEAFIKIFGSLVTFKKDGVIEAWARKITVNILVSYLKSNKGFREAQDVEDLKEEIEGVNESEESIQARDLLVILNQLPESYRNIFNLYVIEGYNHKEISELTGITESSSRTYLTRAKQMLVEIHQNINRSHAETA
jgi:RNA polymerase sigma-70 factor (ECF subfamily)